MTEPIKLSDACEQYLAWRKTNLAPTTWEGYRTTLRLLLRFVGDLPVDELRPVHIERLLAQLRRPHVDQRGMLLPPIGPSAYNSYLSIIRIFSRWMQSNSMIAIEPTARIPRMRERRKTTHRLSPDQIESLFNAALGPRDRALFTITFFAALRAAELRSLRVRDVDLETDTLTVHVAKFPQDDEFPIGPELRSEVVSWLDYYERSLRRTHSRGLEPDDFLVPARSRHRWTTGFSVVNGTRRGRISAGASFDPTRPIVDPFRFVTSALHRIGVPARSEGMHTLRRSAARIMFDRLIEETKYDSALRIVMTVLHHATSATTEQYIGISTEKRSRDEFLRTTPLLSGPRTKDAAVAYAT